MRSTNHRQGEEGTKATLIGETNTTTKVHVNNIDVHATGYLHDRQEHTLIELKGSHEVGQGPAHSHATAALIDIANIDHPRGETFLPQEGHTALPDAEITIEVIVIAAGQADLQHSVQHTSPYATDQSILNADLVVAQTILTTDHAVERLDATNPD